MSPAIDDSQFENDYELCKAPYEKVVFSNFVLSPFSLLIWKRNISGYISPFDLPDMEVSHNPGNASVCQCAAIFTHVAPSESGKLTVRVDVYYLSVSRIYAFCEFLSQSCK